ELASAVEKVDRPQHVVVHVLQQDDVVVVDPVDLLAEEGADDLAQRDDGTAKLEKPAPDVEQSLLDRGLVLVLLTEDEVLELLDPLFGLVDAVEVAVDDLVEQHIDEEADVAFFGMGTVKPLAGIVDRPRLPGALVFSHGDDP